MLKVGFIGTRHGMNDVQKKEFKKLIMAKEFEEFHHGMCEGSDEQAHHLVEDKGKIDIVGHPPVATQTYAPVVCHSMMEPDSFSKRNHYIVDATDILVATPDSKERAGSGTWKTIRYARKKCKRIYIIHSSGRVSIG